MAVINSRAVVNTLEMYGVTVIRLPSTLSTNLNQLVKSLFANNEQGFAYDPNDLTTMFQDAAGTVPVTGVGQPVGLMLDKSKGLMLGGERWDHALTSASGQSSTLGANRYRIYSPDGAPSQVSCGNGTRGNWYEITFTIESIVSGAVTTDFSNSPSWNSTGVKKFKGFLPSPAITFKRAGTTDAVISNISVKEISGNHAYQTTSASRPILRQNATTGAYYLEFDGADDRLVTGSFPSMGLATTIFTGSRCNKAATSAVVARSNSGYLYQTSGQVTVQSVNNPVTVLQSGNTVITVKYAASGTGVTLKANNLSSTDPATTERGFNVSGPLVVGAFDNNGVVPLLGHIYCLIGISKLTSEAETVAIEKELARRIGVTLNV